MPFFEQQATVCKYIVPKEYPAKLDETLKVYFEEDKVKATGADFYFSCGVNEQGQFSVGAERGVAFIAKAEDIYGAQEKVEKAISTVKGEFHHRNDIGTKEMIKSKGGYVNSV